MKHEKMQVLNEILDMAKAADEGAMVAPAELVADMTADLSIYELDFWVVRDRPPYLV